MRKQRKVRLESERKCEMDELSEKIEKISRRDNLGCNNSEIQVQGRKKGNRVMGLMKVFEERGKVDRVVGNTKKPSKVKQYVREINLKESDTTNTNFDLRRKSLWKEKGGKVGEMDKYLVGTLGPRTGC